jgi:hypothetical protein
MKRSLLVLFAFSTLACAQAQSSYVGFHLSGVTSLSGVTPFGGVQVGGPVIDNIELRLSGLPLVVFNLLQLDLLYTQLLSKTLRGYAGGGADLLQFSFFEEGLAFAVHATAGAEADVGSGIGLFAEVQPTLVLNAPDRDVALFFGNAGAATFYGTLALGVNVHF